MSSLRTLRAAFATNLVATIRAHTLRGYALSALLSPVFLVASAWVITRVVAGGAEAPPRFAELTPYPSYLGFVVVGFAANGLLMSALEDGASAVYDEESAGTWDLLALTPMNRFVWMFGKTLAGLAQSLLDFVVVLGAGSLLFDLVLTPAGLASAALGLVLAVVALQGFAYLMAALGLVWKQPYAIAFLLSPVFLLLSGMMVPLAALPAPVAAVARAFPLAHALDVLRGGLLLGLPPAALLPSFGMLLATGAVLMAAGWAAFRAFERRARRTGVLGLH